MLPCSDQKAVWPLEISDIWQIFDFEFFEDNFVLIKHWQISSNLDKNARWDSNLGPLVYWFDH